MLTLNLEKSELVLSQPLPLTTHPRRVPKIMWKTSLISLRGRWDSVAEISLNTMASVEQFLGNRTVF